MTLGAEFNRRYESVNRAAAAAFERNPGDNRSIEMGCIALKVTAVALAVWTASSILTGGGVLGGALALYGCFVLYKMASNTEVLVTNGVARAAFEFQLNSIPSNDYAALARFILPILFCNAGLENFIRTPLLFF